MNILIVEDDKLLQQALEAKFTENNARCTICGDGKEAVHKLEKEDFDAVVLDLVMPEMDGFAVLKAKKSSINVNTPTFVVSNLDAESDHSRALELGAVKCYLKAKVTLKGLVEEIMNYTQ